MPLKTENDNGKKITYKLKFIDSYRFISTSLSNLADNLSGAYDRRMLEMHGMKKKKLGWIVDLLELKTVDWIVNAKNAKNHTQGNKWIN